MKVAGLGFRKAATAASLADALARAGAADALATARAKAESPAIRALAARLNLPLLAVDVAGIATPSHSPRVAALYGTGALAEAAALAALAPGARIVTARVTSQDGMATCAIAQGDPA